VGHQVRRPVTEPQFSPEYFQREDERDDQLFYAEPRLVVHIDEGAIATVGKLFRDFIPPDSEVLDLMSSWRSHWPSGHPKQRLVGLGMNAVEMADNPDLDDYLVYDINADPTLPFEDESFDAVVITVSVQYLTSPIETFQQVNRILRPSGIFIVTFSNRMFPTKAVRVWRSTSDRGHLELVATYMQHAGDFEEVKGGLANPNDSPPGDPLFVVMGYKAPAPTAFHS
jgi:SAM-dependent methyltransferase